jgi:hypothetical protein
LLCSSIDVHTLYAALVVAYDVRASCSQPALRIPTAASSGWRACTQINGNGSLGLFQMIDTVISNQLYRGVAYNIVRYYVGAALWFYWFY